MSEKHQMAKSMERRLKMSMHNMFYTELETMFVFKKENGTIGGREALGPVALMIPKEAGDLMAEEQAVMQLTTQLVSLFNEVVHFAAQTACAEYITSNICPRCPVFKDRGIECKQYITFAGYMNKVPGR